MFRESLNRNSFRRDLRLSMRDRRSLCIRRYGRMRCRRSLWYQRNSSGKTRTPDIYKLSVRSKSILVVGGKKLKNMVSTSTLLYNKENIIRSNILLKNENNQLKGKIAQRTSTLKAARISFFWSFYSFGCRNLTCRYKHQMDRSNTNWDRNGTEIIQCQFKKKRLEFHAF